MDETPLPNNPLKKATAFALKRILDPLIDLMLDTGITVHEFGEIVRECTVQRARVRISRQGGRVSKSRVAIITGLPRAEVSRLLNPRREPKTNRSGQYPAGTVLAAWHDDPFFLTENGKPAVLPIYGVKRSFERLVGSYCAGIPVRAMLDQLLQVGAAEVLPGQYVKANSRIPTCAGFDSSAVTFIGDRTRDLLDTLIKNLRGSDSLFDGSAVCNDLDAEDIRHVRTEIAEQGALLIDRAKEIFRRARKNRQHLKSKPRRPPRRVGITVYYFQADTSDDTLGSQRRPEAAGRKNLRRQPRKVGARKSKNKGSSRKPAGKRLSPRSKPRPI